MRTLPAPAGVLPKQYSEVNGGKNWILLHGFSLQPGEFAKILLIFGTVLVMACIATNKVSWLLAGTALFVGGCTVAYQLFDHVRVRFDTWADPFATYTTTG